MKPLTKSEIKKQIPERYEPLDDDDGDKLTPLRQARRGYGPKLHYFTTAIAKNFVGRTLPLLWGQDWWRQLTEVTSKRDRMNGVTTFKILSADIVNDTVEVEADNGGWCNEEIGKKVGDEKVGNEVGKEVGDEKVGNEIGKEVGDEKVGKEVGKEVGDKEVGLHVFRLSKTKGIGTLQLP
ncbi:hypothetical protein HK102_007596 [Quaeritorhiza haematococci]|nr:hypothetical protein HK102_007596 [Quaeritorhiza haematococci]